MKRLLFATALTVAVFALPQASSAQPSACFNDCRIVCFEPGASPQDYCVDRCGRWSKTTCGSNWNDGACSAC